MDGRTLNCEVGRSEPAGQEFICDQNFLWPDNYYSGSPAEWVAREPATQDPGSGKSQMEKDYGVI
eukprot:scaffold1169_cov120-Cylindrotheca_fusiformis.AAC.31